MTSIITPKLYSSELTVKTPLLTIKQLGRDRHKSNGKENVRGHYKDFSLICQFQQKTVLHKNLH